MDQSCLFRENDRMTGEPSLEEQLSVPIIRLLMASDGVAPDDLRCASPFARCGGIV